MSKGIGIILTVAFLASALVIIGTFETTSLSSTSQGVNLTSSPQAVQDAYNASQNTAIASIAVSHWTIYLTGIFAVIIVLVVLILMVQMKKPKGM